MERHITIAVLFAGILISVMLLFFTLGEVMQEHHRAAPREPEILPEVDYVLGEYGGHLALYRGEQERPYQILSMPVQLLTVYDKEQVAKGIHVKTEQELRQLVEDFTS